MDYIIINVDHKILHTLMFSMNINAFSQQLSHSCLSKTKQPHLFNSC